MLEYHSYKQENYISQIGKTSGNTLTAYNESQVSEITVAALLDWNHNGQDGKTERRM